MQLACVYLDGLMLFVAYHPVRVGGKSFKQHLAQGLKTSQAHAPFFVCSMTNALARMSTWATDFETLKQ